jgi:glycosyltransferase involved in cell wall biosynthesis
MEESPVAVKPSGRGYFVLLSNAHPRKNLAATVEGFRLSGAVNAGYELRIIGNFEQSIPGDLSESVKVLAGLSDEEVRQQIRGAVALLLFSLSEGFGYPVVEAAVLGVVSITSEVSSLAELISPDRVPRVAISAADIGGKIRDFLEDGAFREILAADMDYVRSLFGRQRFEAAWVEVIEEVGTGETARS